jgi:hypothetical protein
VADYIIRYYEEDVYSDGDPQSRYCNFCNERLGYDNFHVRSSESQDSLREDPGILQCWFEQLLYQIFYDFVDENDREAGRDESFAWPSLEEGSDDELCCIDYEYGSVPNEYDTALNSRAVISILDPKNLLSSHLEADGNTSGLLPSVVRSASAEERLLVAKSWISECNQSHQECNIDERPKSTPSRVLDLRLAEAIGKISLVQSDQINGPYAALSHCWGKIALPRTTKCTLARMESGFPILELPPSFRDAIEVCHALDIPFLWIDSLCIVQDDQ